MSKIDTIIGDLEDYIASCKTIPLSGQKIAVNKEEIEDYIRELRLKTPDEIKKYQKLISNRDAILADAREQAEKMIAEAKEHTQALVNEHEIMQQAIEQANEYIADAQTKAQLIIDKASEDANNIRLGAFQYTDSMLADLQLNIEMAINDHAAKYEALMGALNKDLSIVMANRKELRAGSEESEEEDNLAESVKEVMQEDEASEE